jgi:hypothetical protein
LGKLKPNSTSIVGGEYRQVWLSSMFPFPLFSGHLILPLPDLQPTQYFASKYIALVSSVYPPNVNLASLKEREGEPKSLRNRRHQENIKPNLHIQCQTWNRDYAFLHVPIPSALRYISSFSWLTL